MAQTHHGGGNAAPRAARLPGGVAHGRAGGAPGNFGCGARRCAAVSRGASRRRRRRRRSASHPRTRVDAGGASASASGGPGATADDLRELRALLVAAKDEQDALRAERDAVRRAGSGASPCGSRSRAALALSFAAAASLPQGRPDARAPPLAPRSRAAQSNGLLLRPAPTAARATPEPQAVKAAAAAEEAAAKAEYRALHLVRALREADASLAAASR